ncbi:MarR family transcriptional regulator [Nocardia brasiliensis]
MTLRGPAAKAGSGRRHDAPAVHALTVLETVASHGPGISAQELGRLLSMSPASVYDTVNLLLRQGYLVRMPDSSGFALGAKAAGWHGGTELPIGTVANPLPAGVRDVLGELRRTERGGIHLMGFRRVGEATPAVFVVDQDPDVPIMTADQFVRDPHQSAAGRLLLAEQNRDPETKSRGFAVYIDHVEPTAGCLAVPVRGACATLVAGLTLSTTAARLAQPEELVRRLRSIGSRVATELDAAA